MKIIRYQSTISFPIFKQYYTSHGRYINFIIAAKSKKRILELYQNLSPGTTMYDLKNYGCELNNHPDCQDITEEGIWIIPAEFGGLDRKVKIDLKVYLSLKKS